jgi:hypothetical protein
MRMAGKLSAHAVATIAGIIAAGVILGACSSTPGTGNSSPPTTTKGGAAKTVPTDPRLSVKNDDAARKDVAITSCAQSAGNWVAKGTVTNSTSAQATYVIEITYTDTSSTVLGVEKTSVSPAPQKTLSWSTSWPTQKTTGVNCVLDAVSRS